MSPSLGFDVVTLPSRCDASNLELGDKTDTACRLFVVVVAERPSSLPYVTGT
jgi:hypothetical protein